MFSPTVFFLDMYRFLVDMFFILGHMKSLKDELNQTKGHCILLYQNSVLSLVCLSFLHGQVLHL